MEHAPEKHQSIRPSRGFVIGGLAMLLMFAAVWFAVTAAVDYGGSSCPSTQENASSAVPDRCR